MGDEEVRCPECGSNQFTTIKKDISGKKSVGESIISGTVAALLGMMGLLVGTIGGNKIKFTCLKCGHVFRL